MSQPDTANHPVVPYTAEELSEALRALTSTRQKCEKILPKLPIGKSQHTLLARRISALEIAIDLIERERNKQQANDA